MKIITIILSITTVFTLSCTNKTVVLNENELPEDIFYLKDRVEPFSGTCHIYYDKSEILKEVMHFKDGVLNGQRLSYYKNGQIKHEGEIKNGKFEGTWKGYAENGKPLYEVNYTNDLLDGQYLSCYSSGVIKAKGVYRNNKSTGEWQRYDESGMLRK